MVRKKDWKKGWLISTTEMAGMKIWLLFVVKKLVLVQLVLCKKLRSLESIIKSWSSFR